MFSAADLILALQRRMLLRSPQPRRPAGEFPPGWQRWFEQMRERAGAITGATSDAIVAEFLQRPLTVPPRRADELTRWQAFATLWRQQWHPPEPEERKVRWVAGIVSALWHLFFGALLIWLMYLRFMALGTPAQGDNVVQVEYIGQGTPQEAGGPVQPAAPAAPVQRQPIAKPAAPGQAPAVAAPQTNVAQPDMVPSLDMPPPEVVQRDVPEPAPTAEQPVTVSEPVPSAPTVFVLPPTRRRVEEPAVASPELSVEPRKVQAVEVPEPLQARAREIPQRAIEAPTISARVPEVAAREIPVPLPRPSLPEVTPPPSAAPELRATIPSVRTAEIPTPQAPAPATAAAPSATAAAPDAAPAAPAPTASTAPASTAPGAASAQQASAQTAPARPSATAGTGPKPVAAPGGWPSPTRGDDWGDSTRDRPGGPSGQQPGLYNPDGSVRVAETPGSAAPGEPPGTVTEEIKDLDRAGTWLKRKPTDYEPTAFDKYWRPSETLLQEWVRKSIRRVLIPIPGSSKRIVCDVTLLAFGGGCGIVDPNLNEQPAGARPPPDIPFKPALQEDNGSVKP
ncbi:MAG TPA: transmembrane repetitive protein [Lysobacter sp.]